jgi:hypothetical protein
LTSIICVPYHSVSLKNAKACKEYPYHCVASLLHNLSNGGFTESASAGTITKSAWTLWHTTHGIIVSAYPPVTIKVFPEIFIFAWFFSWWGKDRKKSSRCKCASGNFRSSFMFCALSKLGNTRTAFQSKLSESAFTLGIVQACNFKERSNEM